MDEQKFLELLHKIQVPNTEEVKAATTTLRKTYYPNAQSLVWLLQILTSHDTPAIRQQAAVEAFRLVPKHWKNLPDDQKPVARQTLLQSTLNEETKLVRHSAARVISAIATIDLDAGQWEELPGLLSQASTSKVPQHRDVGVYIMFALLEATGDLFADKLPDLFTLFQTTIEDPDSEDVRIHTMLALSRVALLIEPDENPQAVNSFTEIVPAMVKVLKQTVDKGDEDRAMQAFEVFQTLLGCESALLAPHFRAIINFMIDLGTDRTIPSDSRTQALSFLMQCVRYRKMKIQGMGDAGENLTLKSLQIATEITDEEDAEDDEDITPHRSALGLLDLLASNLPPRQVIVPLMKALPSYVGSEDPSYRKAGILALGMCVEGAPDFISTQLDTLLPTVFALLNDPVIGVRQAALHGVARLADDLAEDLCKHHEQLIPALVKNLDAASVQASSKTEQKKNTEVLIAACGAFDSVIEGMDKEEMVKYTPELVPRLGRLFGHPELKVKASAAGAMGSVAGASGEAFLPYFEHTMKALEEYVMIKDSQDELDLRATVCDAMGAIASAVGPKPFQPFVQPLMQATEEALHLDHSRLRETSYIMWSTLAKTYEEEFTPFLPGVVKGLMECLQQEESELEVELGKDARDLIGQEVVVAGKKVKVTAATNDDDDDSDHLWDDEEDEEDDMTTVTAVALEKEVAVEVICDVLTHTKNSFIPYLEKTIEAVVGLVEHSYEGVRKAAISALWRAYSCLFGLMEDHTGVKWTPGLPPKSPTTQEIMKLGEVVSTATLSIWEDEGDRGVVTDINRNVAATLKLCGPAILTQDKFLQSSTSIITSIITRSHLCQLDLGDEGDVDEAMEDSEYDWLVIDTALDAVIGLSFALGDQFAEIWQIIQKPIMKFASSGINYERSTAMGVIAECINNMKHGITQFTGPLLTMLLKRLTDEDPETKSNAAYATGVLVFHSTDSATYLPQYDSILAKLEPLLQTQKARAVDNAAGCVSRMIMAHQDKVPVDDILPILVGLLPLKEDYEENRPIFDCIVGLYQQQNPTIIGLTPQLIPAFAQVLGDPVEQLEAETRHKIIDTVKFIAEKEPGLVQGHEELMGFLRG